MALVTEDGTGKADAEAYATVAAYKARCDAHGITYADRTDTQIEGDLRLGAVDMKVRYRERWAGYRVSTTQALDWPRYDVPRRDVPGALYPSDAVPQEVVDANIEFAIRAKAGTLTEDEEQRISSVSAGSVSVTFQQGSSPRKQYPAIDGLLRPLLKSGGGVALVRA